uniref:Uncharacterized protein n=1 Tax=Oryza brachyantha TaxID=4533 RepID=J3MBK9_ORYBR
MAGFLVLSYHAGVPPSLAVFRHFFKLCLFKLSGWYHFRGKDTAGMLFTGMPKHIKGWKEGFFFLSSPSPWPCQVHWGGPPSKIATAEPVLTTGEEKLAAKLLAAHRTVVDLRRYLCESNLAAAFSSNLTAASPQPPPSRSTSAKEMDPSVFETMKSMRAEKAAAAQAPMTAQKVKTEPASDTPSSGKKRKFDAEANAKEGTPPPPPPVACVPRLRASRSRRRQRATKTGNRGTCPTSTTATRPNGWPRAANYASFAFDYALKLEEKLQEQERSAGAMRSELEEKARAELAAAKAAAVQEYLRSDEHRR